VLALLFFAAQLVSFDDHLRLGQYYLEHKQAGRAATEFEVAVGLQPDSAAAHYNLGAALRLWGDPQGAEKALREALRLQPQLPEAHFVLGLVFGDRVGYESMGLAEFEAAVAQNPSYADAHFNIGIIRWKNGEVDAAIESFRKAASGRPDQPQYHFRLGQALVREGDMEHAVAELKRAVQLDAANQSAWYQLSQAYRRLGDEGRASQAAAEVKSLRERASSVDRDRSGLAYREGKAALERGDLDAAIEHLTRALKAPFDEARIRIALGIAWDRTGAGSAAAAEFHKALELDPLSADAHTNLGVLLMRRGDSAGAEREFRATLASDPNFAEAHFNLGLNLAAQRRWKEAAETLRMAIRLDPANARAHWNLGRVLRDSGDRKAARASYDLAWKLDRRLTQAALEYGELLPQQQAREIWREALKRDPLNSDLQKAFLRALSEPAEVEQARRRFEVLSRGGLKAALEKLDRGDFLSAIRSLSEILADHPDLDEVRLKLGNALFASGQYSAASAECEKLVRSNPDDAGLRLNWGVALREAALMNAARQQLEEAVRLDSGSGQAHYQLGLLWLALGNGKRAMEEFHHARRIDPNLELPTP
jgi:tetratricopeptide (TPR) repeat protein